MGTNQSALTPQATSSTSVTDLDTQSPPEIPLPCHQSLSSTAVEAVSQRDVNFNQPKYCDLAWQSESAQPQSDVVDKFKALTSSKHQEETTDKEAKYAKSGISSSEFTISHGKGRTGSAMTPVTLPTRHAPISSVVTSSESPGVTFAPFASPYSSPISLPPLPNYIPVGAQMGRYPVESYSAMLANMGTQIQLAQEQSHMMHQSYIPSGYITLAGPHVSVPPVLLPAASQDVPRDRGLSGVDKTSAYTTPGAQQPHPSATLPSQRQPVYRTHELLHNKLEHSHHSVGNRLPGSHVYHDTHTVKVGGTYIPAAPSTAETSLVRSSAEGGPSSQPEIPYLDAVLGKTTYTQHASGPGGIRIELPPPTIGIHIGARPPNLVHHSLANIPPLIPKSNIYIECGESSKVVPSSLSAPMQCTGVTFPSRITTPYIPNSSPSNSLMDNFSSTSKSGPYLETSSSRLSYLHAGIKPSAEHIDTYVDRSNNNESVKPWSAANPPGLNFHKTFQVIDGNSAVSQKREECSLGQAAVGQSPGPTDKQKVQSSRPILTAQAPPPMANVPSYFTRGSIIQLANGQLKRVEELQTEDFITSSQLTDGLKIDSSTVSRIEEDKERNVANISFLVGEHNAQVTVEARLDHPFFVYGQGWSSVSPEVSLKCYALSCHSLAVGDVCVSLTVMEKVPSSYLGVPPSSSDSAPMSSHQPIIHSPERKRQRFHETRMAHFEESVEEHASPVVRSSSTVKSVSLDQKSTVQQNTMRLEGVVTDQNRNVVSNQTGSGDVDKEMPQERWSQPLKRRWSDPIKCTEAGATPSKESLPNPPHPTSLAKLTEEN